MKRSGVMHFRVIMHSYDPLRESLADKSKFVEHDKNNLSKKDMTIPMSEASQVELEFV